MLECSFFFSFFEEEWKHTSAHWWQYLISSQSKTCKWTARTQLSELFITGRWRKGSHRTKCLQGERIRTTCYVPLSPHTTYTRTHYQTLCPFTGLSQIITAGTKNENYSWHMKRNVWADLILFRLVFERQLKTVVPCLKVNLNGTLLLQRHILVYCHFSVYNN